MGNKKISELTDATTPLAGSELIEIVQGGLNKKVTAASFVSSGSFLFALWDGTSFPSPSVDTLYYVTSDHGSPGDADYVPAGAFMIGPAGATVFADFYIKP